MRVAMSEGTIDQVKYIRDIYSRFTVLIHEIAKFGIVGGIGFIVQLSITDGVHLGLGLGALTSVVVGYLIATVVTFLGNRHWAFKHRQGKGLGHETTMFFLLNIVGLGIQEAVVAFVHYGLNMTDALSYNLANIVGIGLGTLFRLWSYRKWVFLEVTDEPAEVGPTVLPAEEHSAGVQYPALGMHAAGEHVAGPRGYGMHGNGAHASGPPALGGNVYGANGARGGGAHAAGRHRAPESRQPEQEPEQIYPQPSVG
jgi:putative flippase GtrA